MSFGERGRSYSGFRPEARAVGWSELQHTQREVILQLASFVAATCEEVEGSDVQRYEAAALESTPGSWRDPARSTRVIFLHGVRGAGKSTVYCSFRHYLEISGGKATGHGECDPPTEGGWPFRFREECNDVVVLEPLDLEPLPDDTNLLAALVARLSMVAEQRLARDAGFATTVDQCRDVELHDTRRTLKPIQEIRRLAREIAIAWDGNLAKRAGSVDLDTFGAETDRVERARPAVNVKLTRALACLARALSPRVAQPRTVFLLPVDDFDLNPRRAVALMRLLRMVSTPRLVVLVLGDIDLAEAVFNLSIGGELQSIDEKRGLGSVIGRTGMGIDAVSQQLAAAAMRKLLPPAQRMSLRLPTPAEALDLRTIGGAPGSTGETLGSLMARFPVDVSTAVLEADGYKVAGATVRTLADLLHPRSKEGTSLSYSGAAMLTAPLRNLLDLSSELARALRSEAAAQDALPEATSEEWRAFLATDAGVDGALRTLAETVEERGRIMGLPFRDDLPEAERGQYKSKAVESDLPKLYRRWMARKCELAAVLGREARQAIDEDDHLPHDHRAAFLDAFEENPDGSLELITDELNMRPRLASGLEVEIDETLSIVVPRFREWMVTPNGHPWEQANARAEAALILFHDVLQLNRETGVAGPALAPDPWRLEWAYALWDFGPDRHVKVPWPTPAWQSVWKYDYLRSLWEPCRRFASTLDREERTEYLAFAWIAGCTSVLSADLAVSAKGGVFPSPTSDLWEQVVSRVAALAKKLDDRSTGAARKQRIESWLVALGCLLAPESGVFAIGPVDVGRNARDSVGAADEAWSSVKELVSLLESHWARPDVARSIRSRRARRLAAFAHVGEPGFLRALSVTWTGVNLEKVLSSKDPTLEAETKQQWRRGQRRRQVAEVLTTSQLLDRLHEALHEPFDAWEFSIEARAVRTDEVVTKLKNLWNRVVVGLVQSKVRQQEVRQQEEQEGESKGSALPDPVVLLGQAVAWAHHPVNEALEGRLQPGPDEVRVVELEVNRLEALDKKKTEKEAARSSS